MVFALAQARAPVAVTIQPPAVLGQALVEEEEEATACRPIAEGGSHRRLDQRMGAMEPPASRPAA